MQLTGLRLCGPLIVIFVIIPARLTERILNKMIKIAIEFTSRFINTV